nr:methyltransferase domain-containing protein [Mycoplana azooxidifex]
MPLRHHFRSLSVTAIRRATLDEIRLFHAKMMAAAGNATDDRLERIIEAVPREAFLGPGPWQIRAGRSYLETPCADPAFLYQNVLVALDAAKGINNGEPFLHAAWLNAAAPAAGETVVHVGAGTGYYTALLSMLVLPNGRIHAYEIEADLAARARENLRPFEGVEVIHGDATTLPLPPADLIYVNAGVVAPPVRWLDALRTGGRLIFPWQPTDKVGLALLVTRTDAGHCVRPLMRATFIPCIGASDSSGCRKTPTVPDAAAVRSIRLMRDEAPDETAVAIYEDVWFSRTEI